MKTRLKQWFAAAVVAGAGVWSANAAMTHSAAVVDTRADVLAEILPASCTYALDEDAVLTVTFNESVTDAQYVLPDNMGSIKFDLNGQTLVGAAGTAGSASTAGGDGHPVGKGAFAFVDSDGAEFAVTDGQGLVSKGADGELMRCTLTFDMQGGEGGTESVTVTYGEVPAAIEVPARTGYLFKGVYTEPEGEGTQVYDETGTASAPWAAAEEAKLYAFWQGVPPEFTLVSAKQRWLWNGKVDLVYTVANLKSEGIYKVEVEVKVRGEGEGEGEQWIVKSILVDIPSENGTKSIVADLDKMLPAETQDVAAQLNVKLMSVE